MLIHSALCLSCRSSPTSPTSRYLFPAKRAYRNIGCLERVIRPYLQEYWSAVRDRSQISMVFGLSLPSIYFGLHTNNVPQLLRNPTFDILAARVALTEDALRFVPCEISFSSNLSHRLILLLYSIYIRPLPRILNRGLIAVAQPINQLGRAVNQSK